jgi:lysophospholipase L1-like esterase
MATGFWNAQRRRMAVLVLGIVLLAATPSLADDKENTNSAIKPVPRDKGWLKRHEAFLERAKKGDVGVLFLGDSITQGWGGGGKEVWKERWDPLKAANFGISGDRTEHVLWRITEGKELEGIQPRAVVLMIGTNNMKGNKADEIAAGITAIVKELRQRLPETKVLLLGIFPRSAQPTDQVRDKIKDVNKQIAKLDDGRHVRYLDIGEKFLEPDGTLSKDVMPDYLHLSAKGYKIWADAIQAPLEEMLKK